MTLIFRQGKAIPREEAVFPKQLATKLNYLNNCLLRKNKNVQMNQQGDERIFS